MNYYYCSHSQEFWKQTHENRKRCRVMANLNKNLVSQTDMPRHELQARIRTLRRKFSSWEPASRCAPSDMKLPSGPLSHLLKLKWLRKIHYWTFALDLSQAIVYPLPINNIYDKVLHAVNVLRGLATFAALVQGLSGWELNGGQDLTVWVTCWNTDMCM